MGVAVDSAAKPYADWYLFRTVNSNIRVACRKKQLTMYGDGPCDYIQCRKYTVIQMASLQQSKRSLVIVGHEQNTKYRWELIYK